MELSSFSENIITETFGRNGDSVTLQINIDAIVPDYYTQLEERLKPVNTRIEALQAKFVKAEASLKQVKGRKKTKTNLPSMLSLEKELAEIQREAHAERLTCPVLLPDGSFTALLKGWDITENGQPIAANKENLLRMPPNAVRELWERSIKRATTVKKREDEEDEETLENSPSGTRAPLALAPTGLART